MLYCFQGGTQAGPGLTAFVLISLLENNDLGGVSAFNNSLSYNIHQCMILQQVSNILYKYKRIFQHSLHPYKHGLLCPILV